MKEITISKKLFDSLKLLLKDYIKDNCDYCNDKITSDNFGILSKNVTCCNSFICLLEYFDTQKTGGKS